MNWRTVLGWQTYTIQPTTFKELRKLSKGGKEGLVLLGCGGDLNEWVDGVTEALNGEGIAKGTPTDLWEAIYSSTSTGGRTDLTLLFGKGKLDIGKMAMWRLQFGDASWLSDFVVNYANQY